MSQSQAEVEALIQLLDDPSETVTEAVHARLQALGRGALPQLRKAQAQADEPLRSLITDVVRNLHVTSLVEIWTALLKQQEPDLEQGVFVLALYQYPDLDIPAYQALLDDFAEQIRGRVASMEGFERTEMLSELMFNTLGFKGNHESYYDPVNSYINEVIDRRTGIPISLAVVYLLLAKRLDLPVYGVNMPAHFVVKYQEGSHEIFLDVFNGGTAFTREAAIHSLMKVGLTPQPHYFEPAHHRDILLRMVRNLVIIAREAGHEQITTELSRLLDPWEDTAS